MEFAYSKNNIYLLFNEKLLIIKLVYNVESF